MYTAGKVNFEVNYSALIEIIRNEKMKIHLRDFFLSFIYLSWEGERESISRARAEREGERIPSRLPAVSKGA